MCFFENRPKKMVKKTQKTAKNNQKTTKFWTPHRSPMSHMSIALTFLLDNIFTWFFHQKSCFAPDFTFFDVSTVFLIFCEKKMENTDFAIFGLFFFCCFFFRFSKIQKNLLYKNLKKFSKSQKSKIWVFRTILVKISTKKSI